MIMPVLQAIGSSIAWSILGIFRNLTALLWCAVVRCHRPYQLPAIQDGNIAAGITVDAVILAIAGIVIATIITP